MERQDRLTELKDFLTSVGENEAQFEEVYKRLFNEQKLEIVRLDDLYQNEYLNNIRQTIDKQAAEYIQSKHSSAAERNIAFRSLIDNFMQDVDEELSNLRRG